MSGMQPAEERSMEYTAIATSKAGRGGHVESSDGVVSLDLAPPGASGKTNPEQLFAAGYSACFGSALGAIAKMEKLEVSEVRVTAEITISGDPKAGFGLAAKLIGHLPGVDKATAQGLMEKAHEMCPYSKATRGNIPVTLEVA
jgi:Ohr subfamily peroxiredoxin